MNLNFWISYSTLHKGSLASMRFQTTFEKTFTVQAVQASWSFSSLFYFRISYGTLHRDSFTISEILNSHIFQVLTSNIKIFRSLISAKSIMNIFYKILKILFHLQWDSKQPLNSHILQDLPSNIKIFRSLISAKS